jgi:hypothetical protein
MCVFIKRDGIADRRQEQQGCVRENQQRASTARNCSRPSLPVDFVGHVRLSASRMLPSLTMTRLLRFNPPLVAFILSIAISVITTLVAPLPAPQFHDEFSYLLAGDTFARGRVTNPPHPMWEFFETFQVLSQPTYASKYPPGQGMFLAIGQLVAREPIVGVWLSTALACAAIAWMAGAVLSKRWAMLCGILAATHPQVLDWNWCYWGGSVAMLGGALLIGATLRMRRRAWWPDGAIAGIGVSILANSRPMEGAILSLMCVAWMIAPLAASQIGKHEPVDMRRRQRQNLAEITLILTLNFAWMGYYNFRVTGSATQLPYSLYEKQYAPTRPLAWLPPPTSQPIYRHTAMREFYLNWELPNYLRQRSIVGFIHAAAAKLWDFAKSFGRAPTLAVAFIALPLVWRRRKWSRIATAIFLLCLLNSLPVLTYFPHYTAPAAPIIFLLIAACGFALLHHWKSAGRALFAIILIGQSIALVHWIIHRASTDTSNWNFTRQAFIDEQSANHRKVLVFVRADPGYYVHNEYVYNSADIDAQSVVWARDRGRDRNRELIDYYQQQGGRELMLLDNGRQLLPYTEAK